MRGSTGQMAQAADAPRERSGPVRLIQLLQGDLEYDVGLGLDLAALRLELARPCRSRTRLASAGMFFSSVIRVALRISWHTLGRKIL